MNAHKIISRTLFFTFQYFILGLGLMTTPSYAKDSWFVVNDTVMGGVSSSRVASIPSGGVVFSGDLSLANNGGFTSTRRPVSTDWSNARGVRFTLEGDGRTYIATIRLADRKLARIYYRRSFETVAGTPFTIEMPFSEFSAYAFGTRVPSAPSLVQVVDRIGSVGVMLADKQPGDFSLKILSVEPVLISDGGAEVASQPAKIQSAFEMAISEGVPLFNGGEADRCADVYRTAIVTALFLAPDQLTAAQQSDLQGALQQARAASADEERAWILRRAMDAVIQNK
jgi:hypothetical protein